VTSSGGAKDSRLSDDGKWWWTGTEYIPLNEVPAALTSTGEVPDAPKLEVGLASPVHATYLDPKVKGHKTEIKVRTYQGGVFGHAVKNYHDDASKMARGGWLPQSQSGDRRRLTVTYVRTK
jgi:hypothetical protein